VAAAQADAQVQPDAAVPQAILTSGDAVGQLQDGDLVEVSAGGHVVSVDPRGFIKTTVATPSTRRRWGVAPIPRESRSGDLFATMRPENSTAANAVAPAPRPLRLLVVDDHPAVRTGVAQLLAEQPDLVIADAVDRAETAMTLV
jgi:hypothetical protein